MSRPLTSEELAQRFPALVGRTVTQPAEPHAMAWRVQHDRAIQAALAQRRAQQERETEMAEKGRLAAVAHMRDKYYAAEQGWVEAFTTRVRSDQESNEFLSEVAPLVERYSALDPQQGAPRFMAHYVAQAQAAGGDRDE